MGASAGGLILWLVPESARITSYLEVKASDETSPFEDKKGPVNLAAAARDAAMHQALMKSPLVLEAALLNRKEINDLDAVQMHAGEEVLWMLNELKVSFAADSPILQIEYEGDEPKDDMVKVVDAIVQSYKDNVLQQEALTRSTTRDDLKIVLANLQTELKKKLDEQKAKNTVSDYEHFQTIEYPKLTREISLYQSLLSVNDKEMADLEVMKQVAIATAQSPAALDTAVQAELDKDPVMASYKQKLFDLDQALQQMQSSSKNGSSTNIKRYQAQREQTEQAMKDYRIKAEKEARDRLAKIPNEALRATIVEYNVKQKYLTDKKAELEGNIKKNEDRLAIPSSTC
jgi:hypothetical protein